MRTLKVDRTEGQYTICVDQEKRFFAIDTKELPPKTAVGAMIAIDDAGEITLVEQVGGKGKRG